MEQTLRFTLNGAPVTLEVDPERALLWILRSDLSLTGTKHGCNQGHCGACAVLVDGEIVRACKLPVGEVDSRSVTTIEGLADGDKLHLVQEAFQTHDALQCGFCTPGMIMAVHHLLTVNPKPSETDITAALENNLCRCGAHQRIVQAVQAAAGTTRS